MSHCLSWYQYHAQPERAVHRGVPLQYHLTRTFGRVAQRLGGPAAAMHFWRTSSSGGDECLTFSDGILEGRSALRGLVYPSCAVRWKLAELQADK